MDQEQVIKNLYENVKEDHAMSEEEFINALQHRLACMERSNGYNSQQGLQDSGYNVRSMDGATCVCGGVIRLFRAAGMINCTSCGQSYGENLATGDETARNFKDDDGQKTNNGTNAEIVDNYLSDQSSTLVDATGRSTNMRVQDILALKIQQAMRQHYIDLRLGVKGAQHLHHMVGIFCRDNNIERYDKTAIRLTFEELTQWIIYALRVKHDPRLTQSPEE